MLPDTHPDTRFPWTRENCDIPTNTSWRPIHESVVNDRENIEPLLVHLVRACGADINARTSYGGRYVMYYGCTVLLL